MNMLLADIRQPTLYIAPDNFYIRRCIIRIIGGNAISQGSSMAYWFKSILVNPLIELDGEILALATSHQCSLQRTFIDLPSGIRGLNLYIPKGVTINLEGELGALEANSRYLEV